MRVVPRLDQTSDAKTTISDPLSDACVFVVNRSGIEYTDGYRVDISMSPYSCESRNTVFLTGFPDVDQLTTTNNQYCCWQLIAPVVDFTLSSFAVFICVLTILEMRILHVGLLIR